MADDFAYRPKFVDIRVKKAGKPEEAQRKPSEQPCDHIGCKRPGAHKAPKSRDRANEFWHFCAEHAADYNKRWNYFAGMSEGEFKAYEAREKVGHRPTWTFRSGKGDGISAAATKGAGNRKDPFGLFDNGEAVQGRAPKAEERRLSKLQRAALETMLLEPEATAQQIRARYAELVKKWHPDSNGGDRGAEANLQRVVQAYQQLKTSGLV